MRKKLITLCLALTLAFSVTVVDTSSSLSVTEEIVITPCCDKEDTI